MSLWWNDLFKFILFLQNANLVNKNIKIVITQFRHAVPFKSNSVTPSHSAQQLQVQ